MFVNFSIDNFPTVVKCLKRIRSGANRIRGFKEGIVQQSRAMGRHRVEAFEHVRAGSVKLGGEGAAPRRRKETHV